MLLLFLISLTLFLAFRAVNSTCWNGWSFGDYFFFGVFVLIGGALSGGITCMTAAFSDKTLVKTEHNNIKIVSLGNDFKVNAQFVMGHVYVNGAQCYSVFYPERGGLAKWNFHTDNTIIYQDCKTNAEARIEYDKQYLQISNWILPWTEIITKDDTLMIHVPANTVIERFEVK